MCFLETYVSEQNVYNFREQLREQFNEQIIEKLQSSCLQAIRDCSHFSPINFDSTKLLTKLSFTSYYNIFENLQINEIESIKDIFHDIIRPQDYSVFKRKIHEIALQTKDFIDIVNEKIYEK